MALLGLQKILPSKAGCQSALKRWNLSDTNTEWKTPKFDPSQIRLVIYADNDRDRTLLFDSKAVKRNVEPQPKCYNGLGRFAVRKPKMCGPSDRDQMCSRQTSKFKFTKPGSDVQMLEEIMFGSVGLAYTGTSLKVHLTKSPPQLMLTKVFVPEPPKRESLGSELDSDSFSLQSHSDPSDPKPISYSDKEDSYLAQSVPMDVPPPQSKRASFDIIDVDSGLASLTSSGSFHTPFPSPSSNASSYNSLNSFNSLHRRWMRVQYTSLESGLKKRNSQDNLQSQENSPSCTTTATSRKQHSKIALGILFGLEEDKDAEDSNRCFENFFFSHITLFEGHLDKLRSGVERAYYNRKKFVHIVMEALENFRRDVQDLYTAPRLSEPVWLNMMSHSSYRYAMCEKFMKQFMNLVSKYDNKSTNFFMSTLVTAVLTHHLAWVPTVTPAGGTSIKTYLQNHSPNWVDTFAKTHPYNPLWAQLGDLYGGIGFPLKLARTVVVGKKADLVKKLLYVLTYFIRCSDVHENNELGSLKTCLDELSFDSDITPILEDNPRNFWPARSESSDTQIMSDNTCQNYRGNLSRKNNESGNLSRESCSSSAHNLAKSTDSTEVFKENERSVNLSQEKTANNYNCSLNTNLGQKDCDMNQVKTLCSPKACVRQVSIEKELRRISNEYEDIIPTLSTGDKVKLDDFSLSDEGYHSILQQENTHGPCNVSVAQIMESVPVENVKNVTRAATVNPSDFIEIPTPNPIKPQVLSPSSTPKSVSRLSQKLHQEESASKKEGIENSSKMTAVRNKFLEGGSNSMFDEYYADPCIETMTIDQIDAKDMIVNHPLVRSESIKSSTDSIIRELAGSSNSPTSEILGTHENRLGSFSGGIRPRISSISRQFSTDRSHINNRPTSLAPGRCRSVTPTELSRRRHLSSTSSYDIDLADPTCGCKELDMPIFHGDLSSSSIKVFDRNFGRSLLAGYSDHYLSDFVLHGTSDNTFHEKLRKDLEVSIQHSVLDEPVGEAVCVIADTDRWCVDVASSRDLDKPFQPLSQPVIASQLVCNLMEGVLQLWKLKMSSEFCLMHLEDRLQEIFFKSKMLAEYLKDVKKCNMKELTQLLGFEPGDLPLLVAIAGTHSPHLSLGVI